MGFSRQEHWSGLPFPAPMHESEVKVKSLSRVQLLVTPWTAAYQAPPSMGFSRQEYWSGVPCPSPGCLPDLGSEPGSLALQADSLPSKPPVYEYVQYIFLWVVYSVQYHLAFITYCTLTIGEGNGTPLQYFAWKIPWMEEPGRLQSMGLLRVEHD